MLYVYPGPWFLDAVPVQLLLTGSVLGSTVHRFNYSAFSHSQGIQYLDKQPVTVTLRAIHFPQTAAVSFKRFHFLSPHLCTWWNVLSHPPAFRLQGGQKQSRLCS